ncbi:hypothetical protein [Gluconobacter cerinus]|uniref:hypothetical protein n=1 Tax=Gluconobacter cerinus TaxID=38307 RepID=UPI001FFCAA68|nr:hypothetical protein [Gluconobacter cerinus]
MVPERTMMDWDDVRYFLAVAREAVRSAGYRLTLAVREIIEFATHMEASSHQLETSVLGRDQTVQGLSRVTLPPFLATHLRMSKSRRVFTATSGHRDECRANR